jgi:GNAT superfamily N-acetyltransferase
MIVRAYEPRDRDAIEALTPRLCVGIAHWIDAAAMLDAIRGWVYGSVENGTVFVAEDDGTVVGFASVRERDHFTGLRLAYVGELAVAESSEGRGVGRALMAATESWARERGLARILLETGAANGGARAFYARLGFEESEVTLSKSLT